METTPITAARPIIDDTEISARLEDLELAEADGELTDAQRYEMAELRGLVDQLSDFRSDDYFSPILYRSGTSIPPGPVVSYRWVQFDGHHYLAIATEDE